MSNVQVSEINGLKVYNLTSGRSLYDIMKDVSFSNKKLKKNEEYVNRIDILQDFDFPVTAGCLKVSNDGNYIFASGIYPPKLKIYDLNEMSLKCERNLDSEIRKFEIISDDYSKVAALCDDRNIEIHAQYGKHFKLRIPTYGRDIAYHNTDCDLYSVGSTNEIYRLNLFEGKFIKPFETSANSINSIAVNYPMEILGAAGEKGIVELWDLKAKNKVIGMPILENSLYKNYDFSDKTCINFSNDGLLMAVGNEFGKVNVYDLRNPNPLYTVNHSYKLPIKKIKFHEHSQNIITVDKKLAKFSNMKNGKVFTNIETKNDINDFEFYGDTGMFFFACEASQMEIFFVPEIGPAPKWCSFLENITEELEETKNYSVYEDFKFLTYKDLEAIDAVNLIGTRFVKQYMHGYFIEWKLYKKLKALSEPFAYDKYLEDRKKEKLNKLTEERIQFNKNKKYRVNEKLASEFEKENQNKTILSDPRFERLFTDKNFEIDDTADSFAKSKAKAGKSLEEAQELLDQIEVKEEKEKVSDFNSKIVDPELIKLKEKLLSKKRKKIDRFYGGNQEDMEESLEKRIKKESDDEEEFDIMNKINKINHKVNKDKKIKPKISQNEIKDLDKRRMLATKSTLAKTKFK